jgi:hypothetical protein
VAISGRLENENRPAFSTRPANNSNRGHPTPLVIPTGAQRSGGICSVPCGSLKCFLGSGPEQPSRPHQTAAFSNSHPATQILSDKLLLRLDIEKAGWGGVDSNGSLLRVASQEAFEKAARRTADPSTSLRSGRDDKGRTVAFRKVSDLDGQSYERTLCEDRGSLLRFAPAGMTRGEGWLRLELLRDGENNRSLTGLCLNSQIWATTQSFEDAQQVGSRYKA